MMSKKSFDQGRSTGEREGVPAYGGPDEAYRVFGGGVAGLLPRDSGTRREPIRGPGAVQRLPGTHGARVTDGVIQHPSEFEVQGLVALRMAEAISAPQYAHAEWMTRGMPGKADAPDGTPRTSGRIKAVNRFGLGAGLARTADAGHDPADTPVSTDYLRQPLGPPAGALDKYVGAAGVLAQPVGNASGFTRLHEGSQFTTMGEEIISGFTKGSR